MCLAYGRPKAAFDHALLRWAAEGHLCWQFVDFCACVRASAVPFQSFVIHLSLPETTQQKRFVFRFRLARLWRAGFIFSRSLPGIPVFAWTAARYWIPHAQRHSCSPKVPFSRCPKGPQWPPRAMQALANTRATQEHPPLGAQLMPCPWEVNCFHHGSN